MNDESRQDNRSKLIPNTTQTPNLYLDHCMAYLTSDEFKVLMYTVRRTLGFGKTADRISISQYSEGITTSADVVLDNGTGLSRPTVAKAIKALVDFGLIVAADEAKGNVGTSYSMQLDDQKIQWDKMVERQRKTEARNVHRVEAMRQRLSVCDQSDRTQDERSVGLTANPAISATDGSAISGIDRSAISATDTQNIVETKRNLDHLTQPANAAASAPLATPSIPRGNDGLLDLDAPLWVRQHKLSGQQIKALQTLQAEPIIDPNLIGNGTYKKLRGLQFVEWNNNGKLVITQRGLQALEQTLAKRTAAKPPKAHDPIFDALALICYGTMDISGMKSVGSSIGRAEREIKQAEPTVTYERVDEFAAWWYRCDFRGQKGQRPEPHQIPGAWLKFKSGECLGNTVPAKPKIDPATVRLIDTDEWVADSPAR